MRRTKAEAAETRDAIIIAAEQMFLERGVSQTSIQEIAKQAGVTRGAVYFHFKDKLDIFQAILGQARFPQEEIMLQAAACNQPNTLNVLETALIHALHSFISNERQQVVFTIINQRCEYVGEMAPIITRLQDARANVLSLFTGLLDMAERRSELSSEWTAQTAAPILLAIFGGLLSDWLRSDKNFDLVTYGSKAISTLIRSFRNDHSASLSTAD